MDLLGLFSQAFKRYPRRNIDNKSSVDLKVYFLLLPQAFERYLRRNIDNKSSMDPNVYFLLFPQTFKHPSHLNHGGGSSLWKLVFLVLFILKVFLVFWLHGLVFLCFVNVFLAFIGNYENHQFLLVLVLSSLVFICVSCFLNLIVEKLRNLYVL